MRSLFNGILRGDINLPAEWSQGFITLIKKKPCPESVNDLRPISLLNTDHKILMKILFMRMKAVTDKLIGEEQAACNNRSNVIDNLKILRLLLARAEENEEMKFSIASIYFQQAFDKLDHKYLWSVLSSMGFPDQLTNCLKMIYEKSTSKILVNGSLTRAVNIRRSVRQGCPLSMLLFVRTLTPLLNALKRSIRGVELSGRLVKILAYADDVEAVLEENDDLDALMAIISNYGEQSGAKINLTKSSILNVNCPRIKRPSRLPETDEMKILGLAIRQRWSEVANANLPRVVSKIAVDIKMWQSRNLNLLQRVWITNTYMLSKLWYLSHVLVWRHQHIAKLITMTGKFLWRGHLYRIQRDQLCCKRDKGGLELMSINEKCTALFLKSGLFGARSLGGQPQVDPFMNIAAVSREYREAIAKRFLLTNTTNATVAKPIYKDLLQQSGGGKRPTVEVKFFYPTLFVIIFGAL